MVAVDALGMGLLSQLVEIDAELIDTSREIGRRLAVVDTETQASILRIVRAGDATKEFGELCVSTSRPWLRDRLVEYSRDQKVPGQ